MRGVIGTSVTDSAYEMEALEVGLSTLNYKFVYLDQTASTMDDARLLGSDPSLVLANYQTAGRGRYNRSWLAEPGMSVLMTFVEKWGLSGDPELQSLLPQQVFALTVCEGLQTATSSQDVQVRWPNDLTIAGRKLGGILLENLTGRQRHYPKLFGVGVNVHGDAESLYPGTDYGAISLEEHYGAECPSRSDVVLRIAECWAQGRRDLQTFNNPAVFGNYAERWKQKAFLLGKSVRLSGLGKNRTDFVEGVVLDTPFGGGIVIERDGKVTEIQEFHTESVMQEIH